MAEPLHSETSTTDPAPSARAQASAQVLGSRTFAGSARLTSFLRFVCDETLAGRADQLNEQTIGQHVFGRPAHFNPAEDSIVRSSGRLLRQRLERYYAEEGAADTVRVVVPRGSYVPVFVDQAGRQPAQTDDAAPAPGRIADAEPSPYPRPALLRRRLLAVGAAAGMAASAGNRIGRSLESVDQDTPERDLYSQARTQVDLQGSWKLSRSIKALVQVQNLTRAPFIVRQGRDQALLNNEFSVGRTIFVGLSVQTGQ